MKWFKEKMRNFRWRGVDQNGELVSGAMIALNKKMLAEKLWEQHWILIEAQTPFRLRSPKIKFLHVLEFTRQTASLLQSGILLDKSIGLLRHNQDLLPLHSILDTIQKDLSNGFSFSIALSRYPKYFKPLYCHLIAAGEQTGKLPLLMKQLVQFLERLNMTRSKIKKALFYPLLVLGTSIIISLGLLIFVIPQFQNIFSNFGASLPWFTECVIRLSQVLKENFLSIGMVSVVAGYVAKKYLPRIPRFFYGVEKIKMASPIFGKLVQKSNVIEWCTVFATALRAGVASFAALTLANQVISNVALEKTLKQLEVQIQNGAPLHHAMQYCSIFPNAVMELVRLSETSGALPEALEKIAALYSEELNTTLDHITKLLEPFSMLFVAGMAGSLIIAMYLPVFRMGSVM